jgi:hypothetical protein
MSVFLELFPFVEVFQVPLYFHEVQVVGVIFGEDWLLEVLDSFLDLFDVKSFSLVLINVVCSSLLNFVWGLAYQTVLFWDVSVVISYVSVSDRVFKRLQKNLPFASSRGYLWHFFGLHESTVKLSKRELMVKGCWLIGYQRLLKVYILVIVDIWRA